MYHLLEKPVSQWWTSPTPPCPPPQRSPPVNSAPSVTPTMPHRHGFPVCLMRPGTLVTWPWLRLSMLYWYALRLWFQICITCPSFWFLDLIALSRCARSGCLGPEGCVHTCEMDMEYYTNPNLSVVVAKCWFLRFVERDRTFKCLFHNPYLDDHIILLFTAINGCRAGWGSACLFLFAGNFNGLHQDWLSSTTPRINTVLQPLTSHLSGCD